VKVGGCKCGKFLFHLAGILAGVYKEKLHLDFPFDSELGLPVETLPFAGGNRG
jgi:hypothetical protein